MGGWAALIYGVVCYLIFFVTFAWLALFIGDVTLPGDVALPRSINVGPQASGWADVFFNALFPLLFFLQHSIMARPRFKAWWTRFVPVAVERATFVLIASAILIGLMLTWKTMPTVVWHVETDWARGLLYGLYAAGWVIVLYSSFLIDHFDLFGLRQVWLRFKQRPYHHHPFIERSLYRLVRHPLMLGFLIAFWAAPTMTTGRLLLVSLMTLHILIGTRFEERDLVALLGDRYTDYRHRTSMLLPLRFGKARSEQTMKAGRRS